ncbi:CDP-glycerol glycerophosphotransferase family protein [Anaerocolumna jejuensis]|uniref:CDP-glycerol glycerophosphotransferase family protein n=1 Tax=Anaerocolumna jejuensis TaxID=259063 RepID=UPI003F7C2E30
MPPIKNILRKIKKKIKKSGKKLVMFLYRIETRLLPVNKRIIVFESNMGRNYTGNPKAVYEEMVKQGLDKKYRCYYMLDNVKTPIPGSAVKIRRTRVRYFFLMGIAGVWVSDSRMPNYIKKREGVRYIQTWHGTPLKKLALDMDSVNMAGETNIEKYKRSFFVNTRTWDYLISQNYYSTEIFRRAFAFDKTMLEIGYPRNDVLFYGNNPEYIDKLKKQMGLPLDKKIVLYAPTWRDNEYYAKGAYKFSTPMDFSLLKEQLGEDYVCVVKYHYLVKDNINWSTYGGFVYEFNMCEDISALYLTADILVTDYSSVMFDYSLLRRPMFFFTYDLEDYRDNLRGFYFDFIEEAPGPIVGTTKELIEAIKNYDCKEYEAKYNGFYQKYNHADDGKASAKVVNVIEKIIAGER